MLLERTALALGDAKGPVRTECLAQCQLLGDAWAVRECQGESDDPSQQAAPRDDRRSKIA